VGSTVAIIQVALSGAKLIGADYFPGSFAVVYLMLALFCVAVSLLFERVLFTAAEREEWRRNKSPLSDGARI
jgi:hypothetical protein